MGGQFVTQEDFDKRLGELNDKYDQMRKLVNDQAIVIDAKIQKFEHTIREFVFKKPDPSMIRDAWIRQIPKIRDDLKKLEAIVATSHKA